jgi:hypothetical protein
MTGEATVGASATTHGLAASRAVALARTRIDFAPVGSVTVARPLRSFFVTTRLAPLAVRYATRIFLAFEVALTWGRPVADCPRVALREARGLRVAVSTAADGALIAVTSVVPAVERCTAPAGIAGTAKQAAMKAATTAIRLRINVPVSHVGERQPTHNQCKAVT